MVRDAAGPGVPKRFRGTALGPLVAALLLAGCSGDEPSVLPAPTTAPEVTETSSPTTTDALETTTDTAGPSSPSTVPAEPDTTTEPPPPSGTAGEPTGQPSGSRENCVYSGGGWLCVGPPPSGASATAAPDGAEGSGCSAPEGRLPDGLWYGLVAAADDDSIEFDLACWFSGQAAVDAAAEDGAESPPPNDYYVRNASSATRGVAVADRAQVVSYPTGDPDSEQEGTFADYREVLAERGPVLGAWIVVEGGEVTALREQWTP
jgi:hypothetical protein